MGTDSKTTTRQLRRPGWARLLRRVFDIGMQHCPNCRAGELKIIAAILGRPAIQKILDHYKLKENADRIIKEREG